MTLDQIDQSLSEWQNRLSLAGANLLELDDLAAYQRLRGGVGRPPVTLTGRTQARAAAALAAIDGLWPALQQLTDVIKQAERLRRSAGRLWTHEGERRQIDFLLNGASIQLPSVEAPFAERGLLTVAEQTPRITPDQLLARMTRDFAVAKETVLALDSAWNRLEAALASAERESAALQALAAELGVGAPPDLDAGCRRITALRERVDADPLGVDTISTELVPLQQARSQLEAVKAQRDQLDADLRRARALLSELQELCRACWETAQECQEKIEANAGRMAPPDPVAQAQLVPWLARLEAVRQQQEWKPLRIGLDRWLEAATAGQKQLRDFDEANRALLERREELRGLLGALQFKAGAQAAHGAVLDPALAALAREAEALLHGRPTPLERAAALVAEYEDRLAQG